MGSPMVPSHFLDCKCIQGYYSIQYECDTWVFVGRRGFPLPQRSFLFTVLLRRPPVYYSLCSMWNYYCTDIYNGLAYYIHGKGEIIQVVFECMYSIRKVFDLDRNKATVRGINIGVCRPAILMVVLVAVVVMVVLVVVVKVATPKDETA